MKQLTCEMCGSTDLMKQDGIFVCQTCGCKYSVEEAKKLMIEMKGKVDVTGNTVKVDNVLGTDNKEKVELYEDKQFDTEFVVNDSQISNEMQTDFEKGNILFQCKISYIKDADLKYAKKLLEIGKNKINTVSNFIFYENRLDSIVFDEQPNGFTNDESFSELYSNLRYSVVEYRYMVIYKLLYLTIYAGNSSYTIFTLSDKLGNLTINIEQGALDYIITKKDIEQIIEILNEYGAVEI